MQPFPPKIWCGGRGREQIKRYMKGRTPNPLQPSCILFFLKTEHWHHDSSQWSGSITLLDCLTQVMTLGEVNLLSGVSGHGWPNTTSLSPHLQHRLCDHFAVQRYSMNPLQELRALLNQCKQSSRSYLMHKSEAIAWGFLLYLVVNCISCIHQVESPWKTWKLGIYPIQVDASDLLLSVWGSCCVRNSRQSQSGVKWTSLCFMFFF